MPTPGNTKQLLAWAGRSGPDRPTLLLGSSPFPGVSGGNAVPEAYSTEPPVQRKASSKLHSALLAGLESASTIGREVEP